MRRNLPTTVGVLCLLGLLMLISASPARAQFFQPGNTTLPGMSTITKGLGQLPSNVSSQQLQQIMLLRYLQARRGRNGYVQRGASQFSPFGNNFMPNQMMQNQMPQNQAAPAAQNAPADQNLASDKKTVAEKKAEYQAAREERKRKARERAEARKAEAAARAKAKADAAVSSPT